MAGYKLEQQLVELGCTLGEELLRPTRLYCQDLVPLFQHGPLPHGVAHITGGGWRDNLARLMPPGMTAALDAKAAPPPPIFDLVQTAGNVPIEEMYRTFNMGMGLAVVLAAEDADDWIQSLNAAGHQCFVVGEVISGQEPVRIDF